MASKSDSVQFKYREVSLDPAIMGNFCEEDGLFSGNAGKTDELVDLAEELNARIKEIVSTMLTARQHEVMNLLYYEGLTQTEAATKLGLCQPTIHKTVAGNLDYMNGGKRYGGAIKKIQKLCSSDERIQYILNRVAELRAGQ